MPIPICSTQTGPVPLFDYFADFLKPKLCGVAVPIPTCSTQTGPVCSFRGFSEAKLCGVAGLSLFLENICPCCVGVPVNTVSEGGLTPLHVASMSYNCRDVVGKGYCVLLFILLCTLVQD